MTSLEYVVSICSSSSGDTVQLFAIAYSLSTPDWLGTRDSTKLSQKLDCVQCLCFPFLALLQPVDIFSYFLAFLFIYSQPLAQQVASTFGISLPIAWHLVKLPLRPGRLFQTLPNQLEGLPPQPPLSCLCSHPALSTCSVSFRCLCVGSRIGEASEVSIPLLTNSTSSENSK